MEKREYICLGSGLPWTVQQSSCSPTLSDIIEETNQYMGASRAMPCPQPSQLSSAMAALNSVPVTPPLCEEQFKIIDENFPVHPTAATVENFVKEESAAVFEKHSNYEALNGRIAEGLKQVHFKLQSMEACPKRFVIFDQTGSGARIIFHPAMVYEFPNLLPNLAKVLDNTNVCCEKEDDIHKLISARAATDWEAGLFALRDSMESAKKGNPGLDQWALGEGFFSFSTECDMSLSGSCPAKSQGYQSQFHEDTRDIEALLSSDGGGNDDEEDEEVSTGHTPNEVIIHDELISTQESAYISNGMPRKRRRLGDTECVEEEQEVDFIPATIEERKVPSNLKLKCTTSANAFEYVFDCEHIDEHFGDSSTNSVARKASSKSSATKRGRSSNYTLRPSSSSKKLRIEKMKRTLDLLRSVVPAAGDCMDTAVVLDVATRYLKSLQLQVKKLEANQNEKDGKML